MTDLIVRAVREATREYFAPLRWPLFWLFTLAVAVVLIVVFESIP